MTLSYAKLLPVLSVFVLPALILPSCGSSSDRALPDTATTDTAINEEAPPEMAVIGAEIPILALGDSLFSGYGLSPGESYPEKLETALRARGINGRITNAGVAGNTTADGLARLQFTLDSQAKAPELVLISLGGNDLLRALPTTRIRDNLDAILSELGDRKIPVVLMGMLAPPNLGEDYRREFDSIYPTLARKYNAALVPFFLQPLMDKPDLVQNDHIHPTARGVEEIVTTTLPVVGKAAKAAQTRDATPS